MKLLEKDKNMNFGGELILLICSFVLCVVAALAYIRKDDGAYKKVVEANQDLSGQLTQVLSQLEKMQNEIKAKSEITSSNIFDIERKVAAIEKRPQVSNESVKLAFPSEPLKISVIYREAKLKPKALISAGIGNSANSAGMTHVGNSNTSRLMERAGFKRKEVTQ